MRRRLGCWYEPGDMVWAKVNSLPWWPGRILDEAEVATIPAVSETKIEGHVLVSFFGDGSFKWLNPREIVPFDSNYVEFTEKKKKKTEAFRKAVEEAEDEIRQRAALGLSCCCGNPSNFRETVVPGFLAVDVEGYPRDEKYSVRQIENARDGFRPIRVLCFVQVLATRPLGDEQCGVEWMKNVAIALAYRKAVFQDSDETWNQALVRETPQTEEEEAPFSGPSMHEKEAALALVDLENIITSSPLAVDSSMTPEVASLQNKNTIEEAMFSASPIASSEPELPLFIEEAKNTDSDVSSVSTSMHEEAALAVGDYIIDARPLAYARPHPCSLTPEATSPQNENGEILAITEDVKKLGTEMELETCQGDAYKRLRSTEKEASQVSRDGKAN